MGLLFSQTKNETNIKHPEKIYHEYNAAPTDKSIELLNEFQDKIHANLAEKLLVKDNFINYTVAFSKFDLVNPYLYVKIKINDEEFSEHFYLNNIYCPEKLTELIREWLLGKILGGTLNSIMSLWTCGRNSGYKIVDGEVIR